MEFPGALGQWLFRLGCWIRERPMAAMGPLLGLVAADMTGDFQVGHYSSFATDAVLAPLVALSVLHVANQAHGGMSSTLLVVFGAITIAAASIFLSFLLIVANPYFLVTFVRYLITGLYCFATVATEPSPRQPVRVFA